MLRPGWDTCLHLLHWNELATNPHPGAVRMLESNLARFSWFRLALNRSPDAAALLRRLRPNMTLCQQWLLDGSFADEAAANPSAIERLRECLDDDVDWDALSENEAAVDILEANLERVCWHRLSRNPAAGRLLAQHPDKVDWGSAVWSNAGVIELLLANFDKVNWASFSGNSHPDAVRILCNNVGKIHWDVLAGNRNPVAIELLEQHVTLDKMNWLRLASNPAAIELLERNLDQVSRHNAWQEVSANPAIFQDEFDYVLK